jgi:hypothetical protein
MLEHLQQLFYFYYFYFLLPFGLHHTPDIAIGNWVAISYTNAQFIRPWDFLLRSK